MDAIFREPVDPAGLRYTLCSLLGFLILVFLLTRSFVPLQGALLPLTRAVAAVSTLGSSLAVVGFVAFGFLRTESDFEPGGWTFITFMFLMVIWWGISLVRATKYTVYNVFSKSPTFQAQTFLTSLAAGCVFQTPFGAISLASNIGWWIGAFTLFLLAILVMLFDTDFHRFKSASTLRDEGLDRIGHKTWATWRKWNRILVLLYLSFGIMVVLGLPLFAASGVGCAAGTFLLVRSLRNKITV
jgi:hypothetical protein